MVYFYTIVNTLSVKMPSKINWLVNHTLSGSLVLQQWLTENGISHSLTQKYVQSGWLKKLYNGVYYRPVANSTAKPSWVEALEVLTKQFKNEVHLAGLSSLEQQGFGHYLSFSSKNIWIGTSNRQSLPKWFKTYYDQRWLYCTNSKLNTFIDSDYISIQINGKQIRASSPELAAYEVVNAVGKHITFEHAAELFQGLVNLSPRKVQSILTRSNAVQTNRIFLFLSHLHDHQWIKRLDESFVTLGTGKRQVVENGKYDDRYKITVPAKLLSTKSYIGN